MKPLGKWLIAAAFAVALLIGGVLLLQRTTGGSVDSIAATSLQGLREQNRLSAFAARFVAVVTSEQSRFGFSARKTTIMPGMVRYEVDLSKLRDRDVTWDAATGTLAITLPPIEIAGPEVDLAGIREYDGGGLLMALTDAEKTLDAANRARGTADLRAQALQPVTMKLARDATRRAIASNFAMPLRAAGITATVNVRFADEGDAANTEPMDRSRAVENVIGNAAQ
ncbi:DUF4230 domain-containing protein [Sphingobium boeckii]|uniref:DUF4230 domain-containing protein n=1 Tax=Sphingobium boeckii TaxID=1082345 RepID=A0A7W9AH41_9SPHN|nr:DUF4230 domain-containing protein [Sphingobium boeckii]MBB5685582.1 hypothetical protein [Sphingobium boeckii]